MNNNISLKRISILFSTLILFVLFTASDGILADEETITTTVNNINRSPIANAGPDQKVYSGAIVTLDGSLSSDPDGDNLIYSWTQISGSTVSLKDANTANPKFTAPVLDDNQTAASAGMNSCSIPAGSHEIIEDYNSRRDFSKFIDHASEYTDGEIIVIFEPNYTQKDIDKICADLELAGIRCLMPSQNIYLLKIPYSKSVEETIVQLSDYVKIKYAEPNYKLKANKIPNDTYFSDPSLYGLQKIDAVGAWDTITDAGNVIVAVLDAGVYFWHPDLDDNIWINNDTIDGIDNDGNGYIDDIIGWDFIYNDNYPIQLDQDSHGTMCAGIIGAEGNNNEGIPGVCWNVEIMPLTVADYDGYCQTSTFIEAVTYAINNGVKIINFSYGGYAFSEAEKNAINAADNAGILFITAAGNDGTNNDLSPVYPAGYNCDNIISVSATDADDNLAYFSNYGNTVDIAAPGDNVGSTVYGGYVYNSGTSFSAPYVAGACALVWANSPSLTHLQVKNKILNGADSLSSLNGLIAGARRLNVNRALTASSSYDYGSDPYSGFFVTTSSYYNYNYRPELALDGIYGEWDAYEWASNGEMTPWIRFQWNEAQKINKVILYDRCNPVDHILDAWMYLKRNGSIIKSIHLGVFPYGGAAKEVVFDTVTIDEIFINITDGIGLNVGLSELKMEYDPNVNTGNLATSSNGCTVTVSSEYNWGYSAGLATDGVYGAWDANEWASNGEMTPWIRFKWNEAQKINKVILYDRCNPVDHIIDAWMYLKTNGSIIKGIHLGMFPYGGAAKEVIFDTVTIDEIFLDITSGQGLNVGLSELRAFNAASLDSQGVVSEKLIFQLTVTDTEGAISTDTVSVTVQKENLAVADNGCTVAASSEYNYNYRKELAIDGIYGAWDSNEWASKGERAGAWIQLNWATPQSFNMVVLYDRCNPYDHIQDAWLLVRRSDGGETRKHIGKFPYGGAAKEIFLSQSEGTNIISLQVYISDLLSSTLNAGLSEVQCCRDRSRW